MGWRDRLQPASFRGVQFKIEDIESGFGRAHAVHEYPLVDKPSTEDLGRNADEFTVQGYLIGADYDVDRDRLIKACRDTPGPGRLVHPYQGEKNVVCRGMRIRESSKDGGMCMVSMTFIEAGELVTPAIATDGRLDIASKAAGLISRAKASFGERFSILRMPGHVVDAARAKIAGLTAALDIKAINRDINAVADFGRQVQSLNDDMETLLQTPAVLADRLAKTIGMVRSAFGDTGSLLGDLFDSHRGAAALIADTPSRRQQQQNDNAFTDLVRQVAVAEQAQAVVAAMTTAAPATTTAAGAVTTTTATGATAAARVSHQDVIAARDSVADRLDSEVETTTDDGAMLAAMALRSSVVRALPVPGQTLPNVTAYTPRATTPALVIAHRLYGDAGRGDEIVARNNIAHPAFVPGGRPIEVLSDG